MKIIKFFEKKKSILVFLIALLLIMTVSTSLTQSKYVLNENAGSFNLTVDLGPRDYMLIPGMDLAEEIKNEHGYDGWIEPNTDVTEIVLGDYDKYSSKVSAVADDAVNVDIEGKGSIKLYRVPNEDNPETYTVYILSEGNIYANPSCSNMFYACHSVESLRMENFNTSKVTDMYVMFGELVALKELDLSCLDTSNVTDMSYMFFGCDSLTTLDASYLDTSKVTNMCGMFSGVTALKELDLSSLDTSNVTNMAFMLHSCSDLETVDLRGFDTSKVTNMGLMFGYSSRLKTIYVDSDWDVSNVTDSFKIFVDCNALVGGNGTAWDISHESDISYARIDNGTSRPGYFTSERSSGSYMLIRGMDLAKEIKNDHTSLWGKSNTDVTEIIIGDYAKYSSKVSAAADDAVNVDTEGKGTIKLYRVPNEANPETYTVYILSEGKIYANPDCNHMFFGCRSVESLRMENFNTSKVTDMSFMFTQLRALKELDLSSLDTSNVTNMQSMFAICKSLTTLDASCLDTSDVTNMQSVFNGCDNLEILDLRGFDTSKVTNMMFMFSSDSKLKTIYVDSDWDVSNVTDSYAILIFSECNALVGGNGTAWDKSHEEDISYARIDKGESGPGYFTEKPLS